MNHVAALIVIDTAGALASGSPLGNAFLVDTNGFLGSWGEGTPSLHTICQDGQMVTWAVTPITAGSDVSISGFSGPMVSQGVCAPATNGNAGEEVWSGRVEARGQFAAFPYTVALSVEGTPMTLDSTIKTV